MLGIFRRRVLTLKHSHIATTTTTPHLGIMGQQSILRFFGDSSKNAAKTAGKRKASRESSPVRKIRKTEDSPKADISSKAEDSSKVSFPVSKSPEPPVDITPQTATTPTSGSSEGEASKLIRTF
ncbi:hypothetical protein JCM33374_g5003 [Metschnikowia sp. JCM 33374]|nr:hypothetical protein JCM33374_g5003 [Metschnikowia sp. JCM 33374]